MKTTIFKKEGGWFMIPAQSPHSETESAFDGLSELWAKYPLYDRKFPIPTYVGME